MSKHRSPVVGFFISLCLLLLSTPLFSQQWSWAVNAGGDHQGDGPDRDIAVDRNGTIFIAGYFERMLSLGAFTLVNPASSRDLYIAQMDSTGNVLWAKSYDLEFGNYDYMGMT